MKKTLFLFLMTGIIFNCFCKTVDSTYAKKIAVNFFTKNVQPAKLQLAYTNNLYYYVFNVNTGGFVIVSGNDCVLPILGYATKCKYETSNPVFNEWMKNYDRQISYVIENNIPATSEITKQWHDLNANIIYRSNAPSVSPLISTQWGQGQYFNSLCPSDKNLPDAYNNTTNCFTGCVATAMAQIMKYWNYPLKGIGSHSYGSSYGTLSANFDTTHFNWSNMLANLYSINKDIELLMFQIGISVEMNYGKDVSFSYIIASGKTPCALSAYTTYFNYDSTTIKGLYRSNYTDLDWINLLKNELTNKRPIQYNGNDSTGNNGHDFIIDGYDQNNLFHFNFGWTGYDDGYYNLNKLNPSGYNYNFTQVAITGIQSANCNYSLSQKNISIPSTAYNGSLSVNSTTNCTWNLVSGNKWISFTSDSTGTGNYNAGYHIAANTDTMSRMGYIYLKDGSGNLQATFTINQDYACSYSIAPNNANYNHSSHVDSFYLITSSKCNWNITSDSFITILSKTSGTGNVKIKFSIDVNYTSSQRQGYIYVAGKTFTITQANCLYSISKSSINVGRDGTTDSIIVNTTGDCTWYASTTDSWITIYNNYGLGGDTIKFKVDSNTGIKPRMGHIQISDQVFYIYQDAPCSYEIMDSIKNSDYKTFTDSFMIMTASNCDWTAHSNNSWIKIIDTMGMGNGYIDYSVTKNISLKLRTGSITIQGKKYTINQGGSPNGIEEESHGSINIFPNPTNSKLTVNIEGRVRYEIFDITGRSVASSGIIGTGTIDVSGLSNGAYILRLTMSDGSVLNNKVIVKR